MPHCFANPTVAFGISWMWVWTWSGRIEPAEVVVEQLGRGGEPLLGQVQHRLVLEQVLAALDRPHLPPRRPGHDPLGERHEVGRAGGRPGLEHEHVASRRPPDLDHAHLVVPSRRARRRSAAHPVDRQIRARAARRRSPATQNTTRRRRQPRGSADHARQTYKLPSDDASARLQAIPAVRRAGRGAGPRAASTTRRWSRSRRSASIAARPGGSRRSSRARSPAGTLPASCANRPPTEAARRRGHASSA